MGAGSNDTVSGRTIGVSAVIASVSEAIQGTATLDEKCWIASLTLAMTEWVQPEAINRKSYDALRLPHSLKAAAESVAREDGTTLNQFIVSAVAEKIAALKTADYFSDRAARADMPAFDRFMDRVGGVPPGPEDRVDP